MPFTSGCCVCVGGEFKTNSMSDHEGGEYVHLIVCKCFCVLEKRSANEKKQYLYEAV